MAYWGYPSRNAYLLDKYKIDEAEYERRFKEQGGRCAICKKAPRKIRLAVDHDHKTGRVRGLLCKFCNYKLLPLVRDNATILRAAAEYLEKGR